ncbi:hypothetical protein [Streptomyces sp. SP17BM10]|uniref:hypothetical protein n=1 Tax=Streptomyces sp. SP17BM10 TaxID=3002530 RepID=UPI003FCE3F66
MATTRPAKLGQPFTRRSIRKPLAYPRKVHGRVIRIGREATRTTPTTRSKPAHRTPTCAGATPTPAIPTSWPPSKERARVRSEKGIRWAGRPVLAAQSGNPVNLEPIGVRKSDAGSHAPVYAPTIMKFRVEFTEQAGRLRDYLPPDDRRSLLRLVSRIADDPYGPDTHLAFTNDELTRSSWSDSAMVNYIVVPAWNVIYVVAADIYDANRGFNII